MCELENWLKSDKRIHLFDSVYTIFFFILDIQWISFVGDVVAIGFVGLAIFAYSK